MAEPQRQTFKDGNGRTLGRSVTDTRPSPPPPPPPPPPPQPLGNTTYYNSMGRNTGRSVTNGNTTTVYDNFGRRTGSIQGSR